MLELFSSEFLNSLREEVRAKAKTSKALLDAIKDLSSTNQNYRKRLAELEGEITSLKSENSMLLQILQSTKKDYENRITLKNTKLSSAIEIEAKLFAENEALKNQVSRLKDQILIFKTSSLADRNSEYFSKNEGKERSITEIISNNSEYDLNVYLFSQRDNKTEKSIEQNQNQKENDVQQDKIQSQRKFKQRSNHKSELELNQSKEKNELFYSQILHEENENQ